MSPKDLFRARSCLVGTYDALTELLLRASAPLIWLRSSTTFPSELGMIFRLSAHFTLSTFPVVGALKEELAFTSALVLYATCAFAGWLTLGDDIAL